MDVEKQSISSQVYSMKMPPEQLQDCGSWTKRQTFLSPCVMDMYKRVNCHIVFVINININECPENGK